RGFGDDPILHGDPRLGWNPPERRDAEEFAAVDHLAPRFGHRRDAEFKPARDRSARPGRVRTAEVFFPDPEPRKIVAAPDVPEREARFRVECDKERVVTA